MSLVQVLVAEDRIRMAVDTLAHGRGSLGGRRLDSSKLLHLPHSNLLFAIRGSTLAFFQIYGQTFFAPRADYDATAELMASHASNAHASFPKELGEEAAKCELFVGGYSRVLGRMAVSHFMINLLAGITELQSAIQTRRVAPASADGAYPALDTDAGMLKLAKQQLAWMRQNQPAEATGGRLLVGELTRRGCSINSVGEI